MPVNQTIFKLVTAEDKEIGWVDSIKNRGDGVCGEFHPLSEFEKFRDLFANHELAIEDQSLSIVDLLESAISEIHFFASSELIAKTRVFDVQIIGDRISFKWRESYP